MRNGYYCEDYLYTNTTLPIFSETYVHVQSCVHEFSSRTRISTNGNDHILLQKQMRGSSGSNTLPNDAVPWVVSAASFGPVGWASGNKRRWSSSSHRLSINALQVGEGPRVPVPIPAIR